MKGSQLMQEAVKTASVFGNRAELSVRFQGNQAMTDGSVITLPMVEEEREFSKEEVGVARGFLDHEAGHIKHTEMAMIGECRTEDEKACLNFMEDARIERLVAQEYAGAADNLATLNNVIGEKAIKALNDAESVGRTGLYAAIFNEHHRRLGIGAEVCGRVLDALPKELVEQAQPYVDRLLECESTKDVHTLVKELVELEVEPPEEKSEQEPSEESEGESEGESEEGRGEQEQGGEASGKGDGESKEDKEAGEAGEGGEAEGKEGKEGKSKGEGGSEGGEAELGRDPSRVLREMLGEAEGVKPKWKRYSSAWDMDITVKSNKEDVKRGGEGWDFFRHSLVNRYEVLKEGNAKQYKKDHQKIKGYINKVKRELENKLLAKRDLRWESGQRRGRFDVKRCVAAFGGREDVFEVRREDKTLDTVVTLMIDHSGSMRSSTKMGMARLATICLGEVLSKVGIPFKVVGFDAAASVCGSEIVRFSGYKSLSHLRESLMEEFTDHTPIFHVVYKGFDEGFAKTKAQIGTMGADMVGSHNCDPASIYREWALLKKRNEAKKIIIVLSDGIPETDWGHMFGGRDVLMAATKTAIETVVKEGGVISAIGIGNRRVKDLYDDCAFISEFEDLPKISLKMLERGVLGGGA